MHRILSLVLIIYPATEPVLFRCSVRVKSGTTAGEDSGVLPLFVSHAEFSTNAVEPRNLPTTHVCFSLAWYMLYIFHLFSQFAINNDKLAEVSISSFPSNFRSPSNDQ